MTSGEARRPYARSWQARNRQCGFTYVAMLLAVALIGIGLAATGEVWSVANQRERERQLLFVGHEFRSAIQQYYEQTPGAVKRFPMKLEDLLQDNRYPSVKRHLRRIYPDPMTGKADWGLVSAPGGGVQGIYSTSKEAPLKQSGFDAVDIALQGAATLSAWRFVYEPNSALNAAPNSPLNPTANPVLNSAPNPAPNPAPK